jgi:hypothetical protein
MKSFPNSQPAVAARRHWLVTTLARMTDVVKKIGQVE